MQFGILAAFPGRRRPDQDETMIASDHSAASTCRPFNLLRWFSALGLVTILFTGAALAWFMTSYLTQQILMRDAEVSRDFIESIIQTENSLAHRKGQIGPRMAAEAFNTEESLNEFIEHIPKMPHVTRANLYSVDRTVVWSSDARLIGQRFERNEELEKALQNQIVVEAGVSHESKPEHVGLAERTIDGRFVEAYLPIRDETGANVVAVVEIYRLPKELFRAVDNGARIVWASAAAGGLVLYLALFWIVHRADLIMREQRKRLVEAETLSAIGEMAAAVAHSIRNPLASIRSAAEIAAEEDSAGQQQCMQNIMSQADRLDGWVRELLAASRGEGLRVENLDLNAILHESLDGVLPEMRRRGIDLVLNEAPLPPVLGTRAPIAHAIRSVVSNAVEAMPDGGRLRVESRSDKGHVQIAFEDTGPGMPASVASQAFRPLFTTKPNGIGLGLALARRIMERHAGRIELDNAQGCGTRVVLSLPAGA